jgi:uncharacterized membrane protein YbhN (UPF0104 family)
MSSFVWKFAVSVTILALILSRINLDAVGHAIGRADVSYLSLALLLSFLMVVSDVLLWQSALRSLGHTITRAPALLYAARKNPSRSPLGSRRSIQQSRASDALGSL